MKNYHGFLGLPRHSKLLLNDLGYDLFGFYIGFVMEAVWFRGNPQMGYVTKSQNEIAVALGCDQSTVSRNLKKLEEKKYILRHTKHKLICLKHFPLFLTDVAFKMYDKNYANLDELYADMHKINAELQEKYVESQGKRAQKDTQRLYNSSKGNSSSSDKADMEDVLKEGNLN